MLQLKPDLFSINVNAFKDGFWIESVSANQWAWLAVMWQQDSWTTEQLKRIPLKKIFFNKRSACFMYCFINKARKVMQFSKPTPLYDTFLTCNSMFLQDVGDHSSQQLLSFLISVNDNVFFNICEWQQLLMPSPCFWIQICLSPILAASQGFVIYPIPIFIKDYWKIFPIP